MSRRFKSRQRMILAAQAAGQCQECGDPLPRVFHADHIIPVALGGPTTLNNGRATCPKCNLRKGKNMISNLRDWQISAHDQAVDFYMAEDGDKHFVVNAAPGAGKTRLACAIAKTLLALGLITRVIVIAPRRTIVEQWAKEFSAVTGRGMQKITAADSTWLNTRDVCATWNAVEGLRDVFQALCREGSTLVICDEHHHAAIEAAWGTSADSAFCDATYSLILTGTPVRSDGSASVWLNVDEFGALSHDSRGIFTLTYGQAVELGYCRPLVFHRHWGQFTVELQDGRFAQIESGAAPVLPEDQDANRLLRSAVNFDKLARTRTYEADNVTPKRDSYQASMVAWASEKLDEVRFQLPEAGGLVIAPNIKMAAYFAKIIERHEGEKPCLVHSELPGAESRIGHFRNNPDMRWLVSVGMVAEGVDVPRLRVLIYLPSAMTELAFRQAMGRVVRNYGPSDASRAYVIMPAVQKFDEFARRIEEDMPTIGAVDEEPPHKVCRICREHNDRSAAACRSCGTAFPSRTPAFTPCGDCGALNKVGNAECQACGVSLLQPYEIKLSDAARDGIISRGISLPEDEVKKAEAASCASRDLVRRAEMEDQVLARFLRSVPLEIVPALVRLAAEAGLNVQPSPD